MKTKSKDLKGSCKGSNIEIDVKGKIVFFWINHNGSGFHTSISIKELKELLE